jgi:hypothetical protein
MKLPVLYLMDSIIKNVGGVYIQLFSKNLFNTFCNAFDKVDFTTKNDLVRLWQTWKDSNLFTPQLLKKIEIRMNTLLEQRTGGKLSIYVNPSFVRGSVDSATRSSTYPGLMTTVCLILQTISSLNIANPIYILS